MSICVYPLFYLKNDFVLISQKREKEFTIYMHEKFTSAKTDFRNLLKESKVITYKYVN